MLLLYRAAMTAIISLSAILYVGDCFAQETAATPDSAPAATQVTASSTPENVLEPEPEPNNAAGESNEGGSVGDKGKISSALILQAALAVFIALYAAHAYFVVRKQSKLKTKDEQFWYFVRRENSDAIWTFLLVTCFLPLGITIISVAADSLNPSDLAKGATRSAFLLKNGAFLFWGLSKSVFVLMITLEISYLYNSRSAEWQPMITSALVLDILAFLLFTSLLQEDSRTAAKAEPVTIGLMAFVGLASFSSSFLTILFTRGFEQYYSLRHGLRPADPMRETSDPFPQDIIDVAVRDREEAKTSKKSKRKTTEAASSISGSKQEN